MKQVYRHNPRTAGRVIDGIACVVTPNDNRLHTLNAAGTAIWVLAQSGCTLEDMVVALVSRFKVDEGRARADAERFCADLIARGLLEPA